MTSSYHNHIISVAELSGIYSNHDIVVIDCRNYLDDESKGRNEYLNSHIPGAMYFDLKYDLSGPVIPGVTGRHPLPDPTIFLYKLKAAGISNQSQVIAYDQSNGVYASRAWWLLRWIGHHHVRVLDGGFSAWLAKTGPVDNQWPLPKAGSFTGQVDPTLIVNMHQVPLHANALIDSRELRRYTGEYEPIDPVAGHIPGAVCIPYQENVSGDGFWKSPQELMERFEGINETPVFYCGSGVTACHNILAYKIATGKDAFLYPGSWSEWIQHHKGVKHN